MNELIKIEDRDGKKAVNARDLHAYLESRQEFTHWIKGRIRKYGFSENVDFASFDNFIKRATGGTTQKEYALSISCAKEISMVEGNDKGKVARRYFIEQEEKALKIPLLASEYESRIAALERKLMLLETSAGVVHDYFTIAGYARMCDFHLTPERANELGRVAKRYCKERNIKTDTTPDPRYGYINTYPREALKEVFRDCLK